MNRGFRDGWGVPGPLRSAATFIGLSAFLSLLAGCSTQPGYAPGCYLNDAVNPSDRAKIEEASEHFYALLRSHSYDRAIEDASAQLKTLVSRDQLLQAWSSISETLTIPSELTTEEIAIVAVKDGARGPQSVTCASGADSLAGRTISATDQPLQAYLVHTADVGENTYRYSSVWYFEDGKWRVASFGAKSRLLLGRDWQYYRDLAVEQHDKGNKRNAVLLYNVVMDLLIPALWIRPDEVRRLEKVQRGITVYEVPLGKPLDWRAADSTAFHPYLVVPDVTDNGLGLKFAYEVDDPDTAKVVADAPKLAEFIRVTFPEYREIFHDLTLEAYTKVEHRPVWRSHFSLREGP